MANTLSEKQVLKKLHIPDFRHLSKKNVIHFASMLDKMDSEIAKKAIEQFPEFSKTLKEVLSDYKETINKGIESNNESMRFVHEAYSAVIASLQKELDKDNLSFDEKKYLLEKMEEIADKVNEADKNNKKFIAVLSTVAGGVALVLGALLLGGLGGRATIESTDNDDNDFNFDDNDFNF